ncbi:hypothetical protein KIN20_019947 [Parelaphostrongylus tenuis]|uniref:SXP/RAL-2 family protein Ani s 5-like cation-binding domain-containing protein n=1 Tax=Parelaphostrongylus tenuis TaxID=148309 RepID=A0AAD5MLR6_PARTN|nr:hypothetical protein KIN20_019947 [Parelaphostrongylus tenuis]
MQLETALECWLTKYGVEVNETKCRALLEEFKEKHTLFIRSLTELPVKLTALIAEYTKIADDKKQVAKGALQKVGEIYMTMDEKQKAVVSYMFQIYSTDMKG